MSRSDPQFNLRIPLELKEYLEQEAKRNKRSVTAEILERLEASILMDQRIQETGNNLFTSTEERIARMSVELANLAESIRKKNSQKKD